MLTRGNSAAVTQAPVETEDFFEKPHRDWSPEVSYAREYFHLTHFKEILEIKCKFEGQPGARKEWAFNERQEKVHVDGQDEEEVEDEADNNPLTMFDVAPEEHKPASRWATPKCDCALGGDECIFQDLKSESESRTPTRSSTFSSQDNLSTTSSMTSWSVLGRHSQKVSPLDTGLSVGSQNFLTTSPSEISHDSVSSPRSLRSWYSTHRTSSRRSSARLSQQSITMSQQSGTSTLPSDPPLKPLSRAATDSLAMHSSTSPPKSFIGNTASSRTSEIYRNSQLTERPLNARSGNPLQQSYSSPSLDKMLPKRESLMRNPTEGRSVAAAPRDSTRKSPKGKFFRW